MTEEHTPKPMPQASHSGWVKTGAAPLIPNGVAAPAVISMDRQS